MKPSEYTKEKIKALWDAYKATKGNTQVTLADASGTTQENVSLWTRGRLPNVDGIVQLSRGFDVPILDFFPAEYRQQGVKLDPAIATIIAAYGKLNNLGKVELLLFAESLLANPEFLADPSDETSKTR